MSVDDGSLEWFKGNLTRIESGVASGASLVPPALRSSHVVSCSPVEGQLISPLFHVCGMYFLDAESTDPSIHLSNLISWVEWGVVSIYVLPFFFQLVPHLRICSISFIIHSDKDMTRWKENAYSISLDKGSHA